MNSKEDLIRKRVSYAKLHTYFIQNKDVTIGELTRLHTFLDTNMLYGSRRIANLYGSSLAQLVEDLKAGIEIDTSSVMDKIYKETRINTLTPQPYYALIHRGYIS